MLSRTAFPLVVSALLIGSAAADTAYVRPSTFTPEKDQTLTVEVSFSDLCCEPSYSVRTDTFAMIGPDGEAASPDRVEVFSNTTILEHTFTAEGTTRISTGERLGRKGEYVELDGKYHLINSPDAEPIEIPDGTPILSSQTATVTDAYVTVGPADWGAIRTQVGRLAIEPLPHPNSARIGELFAGRVTLDGAPVAEQTVLLTNEAQRLRNADGVPFQTDSDGRFDITFSEPGVHLIMVRLQAPAPQGAETDIRSYTTALTLSVPAD
ncbi:MAG: DUF4198 domain-containing protein [Henriciella sp.]|nr:DUF4198 domain-containing protein [Henriciella sp.]